MLTLHLGPEPLARSRFAVSRLAELSCALEVLTHPDRAPFALGWVKLVRPRLDRESVALVYALVEPDSSYVPDFLVPLPAEYEPTLDSELAAVAATPAEIVRQQLARTFGTRLPRAVVDVLDAGGERAVAEVAADQLRHCWDIVLADAWPALRRVLDEDVRQRAADAAREGFGGILTGLHPTLHWDGRTLTRATSYELTVDARPGLVLLPSVFLPWPALWHGTPDQVLVGYPARGRGTVWSSPRPVLGAPVLGPRRLTLLADLRTARSTSELSSRHGLSPATVSYHLARLRADDLVARRREGHSVLYGATERALALLAVLDEGQG